MVRAYLGTFAGAMLLLASRVASAAVLDTTTFTEESFDAPGGVTSMAWAPDASERLFLTIKDGPIRIIENGELLAEPFAVEPEVETNSECGVLGIAFDPAFSENQYVYFFVTVSSDTQQIIRYTANGDVGTDRSVIIDDLPTNGQNHDGGGLAFGPDGLLYWSIGDLGNGTGVDDDFTSMAAKIGRANPDGTPAAGNPYDDGDGPVDERIWARGFRNPFTLTFQPSTERLWVNTVGTSYEQVFRPSEGDHAGYNDYENNQPDGFLAPVIAYRTNGTDSTDVESATRAGGIASFTTTGPNGIRLGARVTVSGAGDESFNTSGYVSAVNGNQFSIAQDGADMSSSGGEVTTEAIGGCITGGTFWDSSAPPAEYRGNFFFGDYNSGRVERVTLDSSNQLKTVEHFATSISQTVDMDIGPDGNLYYASIGGRIYRTSFNAAEQGLVVSRLHRRGREGSSAFFHVRLATEPASDVDVAVEKSSGSPHIVVESGAELTFTTDDWQTPQPVEVRLGLDSDTADDAATLTVSSSGLAPQDVLIRVTDSGSFEEPGEGGMGGEGGTGGTQAGQAGESNGGATDEAGAGGEPAGAAGEDGAAGDGTGGTRAPTGGTSGRGGAAGRGGTGGAAGRGGSAGAASGAAGSPASDEDDGCGCRTPGHGSRNAALPLFFAFVLAVGARRRARTQKARYAGRTGGGPLDGHDA